MKKSKIYGPLADDKSLWILQGDSQQIHENLMASKILFFI